jgi:hypothetical protein
VTTTYSTYKPSTELQRRIIDLLRADPILSDPLAGLLFPQRMPKKGDTDVRVYSTQALQKGAASWVRTLPRIAVEGVQRSHDYEQDSPILVGPVKIYTYTVVDPEDEQLGEQIDAYLQGVLPSTWLSDARIITSKLTSDGDGRRERLEVFNGAWQFVGSYSTPSAGSLQ